MSPVFVLWKPLKSSETLGSVPVLCNRTNGPAWYLAVGFALKCGRWREAHSFSFVSEWMETQGVLLEVFLLKDKFNAYKYAFTFIFFCTLYINRYITKYKYINKRSIYRYITSARCKILCWFLLFLVAYTFKSFILFSSQLLNLQEPSFYIYYQHKNDIFLTVFFFCIY